MQTYGNLDIQEIPLSSPYFHAKVERFLAANGLRLEEVDLYLTLQDADGEILAGGGLFRDIIKCIAVAPEARSEGLAAPLVSRLIAEASARNIHNLKVFTKPENVSVFESLGFRVLAQAPKAVLMENGRGLEQYCAYLRSFRKPGRCGVVVMNANPFTLGHQYLIEKASGQVDTLFVIPVKEDVSQFPYAERLAMIQAAVIPGPTGDLLPSSSARPTASDNYFSGRYPKNQFSDAITDPAHADAAVIVVEGSDYCISAATFPTYFLKDLSDSAETQMRLDINLFCTHIAPALGATVRFVGSEPEDALTARYNALLQELMPGHVVEIPRLQVTSAEAGGSGEIIFRDGARKTNFPEAIANPAHADASFVMPGGDRASRPVSASDVRAALERGSFSAAASLTPATTHPYLLAELAERALRMELDTPQKPGLVGPDSSGAHKDMDYALMLKGISAIRPFFPQMAVASSADELRRLGIEAEKVMMAATGGVNTHRGAIFCIGLALNAAGQCFAPSVRRMEAPVNEDLMQICLGRIAETLFHKQLKDSELHSTLVGARRMAAEGYRELFQDWLPFYRHLKGDTLGLRPRYDNQNEAPAVIPSEASESHLRLLLLRIMSTLDDTCVIHRVGAERAEVVKREAKAVLQEIPGQAGNDRGRVGNDKPSCPALTGHLAEMCSRYAAEGISPGGAADMVALTLFMDSILD